MTLMLPHLAFAVIVEWKYTTEYLTRTGAPPTHTPKTDAISSESAQGKTLSPATIPASSITPVTLPASVTSAPPVGSGVMNIAIENHWPEPLSISYGDNEGSPGALGAPSVGPLGTSTEVVYPTGWAGRIYIGKTINSADSKIEGSTTGANDIDVSYVDGYSVPITCSVAGTPVTGCNIDLFTTGNCTTMVGQKDVCLNPMQGVADGPAVPFFLPCQGAAYTFPNDNVANNGDTGKEEIKCCIGTEAMGCKAPERQGKGNNRASKAKRAPISEPEQPPSLSPHMAAHAHSHLARHLNNMKSHRHGFLRRAKEAV